MKLTKELVLRREQPLGYHLAIPLSPDRGNVAWSYQNSTTLTIDLNQQFSDIENLREGLKQKLFDIERFKYSDPYNFLQIWTWFYHPVYSVPNSVFFHSTMFSSFYILFAPPFTHYRLAIYIDVTKVHELVGIHNLSWTFSNKLSSTLR